MNEYKINIIYGEENINNIFKKSLVKELKKYISEICKKSDKELSSIYTYLSVKNKEDSSIDDR